MTAPLIVLAGGRATRLGAISEDTPKFLVPLGGGKVFADIQLHWLRERGFYDVTLSVGYRAEQIRAYCGDGSRFGLKLRYVEDGPTPLGTGGAVKKCFERGPVCVTYGDTILEFDLPAVLAKGPNTMTVMVCPTEHQPNADLRGDRVVYNKRNPDPSWRYIDYGFLLLSEAFVRGMPDTGDLADSLAKTELFGVEARERFWEINTPESLEAFKQRFALQLR